MVISIPFVKLPIDINYIHVSLRIHTDQRLELGMQPAKHLNQPPSKLLPSD